jgi:Na+/H+ antiporter NhaB
MKEEFESILKQKTEQFAIEPSTDLWSKIDAQMGAQVLQKAKFDWTSFFKTSLNITFPLLIAGLFGAMFYINAANTPTEVTKNVIQKPVLENKAETNNKTSDNNTNLNYSIFQPVGFIATIINQADTTEQKAKDDISDEKIDELVNQEVEKYQKTVDHYRATIFFENEKKADPKQK